MREEEFEKLVDSAILNLPEKIRKKMDNVEIIVETKPSQDQLKNTGIRGGGFLLGLYQGIPQTQWGKGFGMNLPDKITIFQQAIENICRNEEEIKETIKIVVWHEIAHHFGLDHDKVHLLEQKWKKQKKK